MASVALMIGWLVLSFLWSVSAGVILVWIPISETQILATSGWLFAGILGLMVLLLLGAAKLAARALPYPPGTWFLFAAASVTWIVFGVQSGLVSFIAAWLLTAVWIWFGAAQQSLRTVNPRRSFTLLMVVPLFGLGIGCSIGWYFWLQFVEAFHIM